MPTKAPSELATALCLVLRVSTLGEADLMLTLFDRTQGLITARAYGAKSLKSRIRAACQPFCIAEFEFYVRSGRLSVKAASVRSEFSRLQDNYPAYICGCVVLELTEKILRNAPDCEELFHLTVSTLQALNTDAASPKSVLLFYLMRLTHHLGVFPVVRSCASCGKPIRHPRHWSSPEGGTVCEECAHTRPVQNAEAAVLSCLAHFGRGQIRDLAEDQTPAADIDSTCRLLLGYLRAQYDIGLRTARMLPAEKA